MFSSHCSRFSKKATEEVERFHQHKNANLQESLANYVILQLKLSKMVSKKKKTSPVRLSSKFKNH